MSTTTLAGLAKTLYPDSEIKDMEQRNTTLLKEFGEGKDIRYSPENGGTFKFATKLSGPHGQKMINEQEALPGAASSSTTKGTSTIKEYAGVVSFTKRELELAKKDGGAALSDNKTFEMEGLIENAHKYFNRQLAIGDGSGDITLVNGAQTATAAGTAILVDDATHFQIGQIIDIFDATGAVKQVASATITDINILTAQSIDVDVVVTCDDDAIICIAGVKDNASTDGKEMIGFPLATDDGTLAATFQGITRATSYNYKGVSLDASSNPISVSYVNQALTRALRVSGVDLMTSDDVIYVMSPEQWRAYASLSTAQIRFMPSDNGDMNKTISNKPTINGHKVVQDTDVDRQSVYIVRKNTFCKRAIPCALDWESDLGGTSLKWLSGYAQGIMLLYSLQQNYFPAPRDGIRIHTLASVSI